MLGEAVEALTKVICFLVREVCGTEPRDSLKGSHQLDGVLGSFPLLKNQPSFTAGACLGLLLFPT